MSELQKAFQNLQPHLLGIRYHEGMPILEVQFKEGWVLPKNEFITRSKMDDDDGHYMLFSQAKGIGLDELLNYLEITIKANVEREKKIELLKLKIGELQEIFKSNSLVKLQRLRFTFPEEDYMPDMSEIHLEPEPKVVQAPIQIPEGIQPEQVLPVVAEISDDEREMLEEEERAANFKKLKDAGAFNKVKKTLELPPKKKIANVLIGDDEDCSCGPDQACSRCVDNKDL